MSTTNEEMRESLVICQTSQGVEIHASLLRISRHLAIFEIYDPNLVLRASEVFEEFRIISQERTLYTGRAVVRSALATGMIAICEVALEEGAWRDVEFTAEMLKNGWLAEQYRTFLKGWEKYYKIAPEYKVIISDMETYFVNLRLWLDQVELGIRSSPSGDRVRLEEDACESLTGPVIPCVNVLFEKFEAIARNLEEDTLPAHRSYMRQRLHPVVLCAPFAYRTFQKPLGYAGDYEMVNMIVRNRHEGGSLFAKVLNTWFLRQPPATAHRNRVQYLLQNLIVESLRAHREHRPLRILSIGCGPAVELQRFLSESELSGNARITLLDFDEETLQHAQATLSAGLRQHRRQAQIELLKKSVQQILKESARYGHQPSKEYDLIYCAGLFDYLSDQIALRLMTVMYDWLAPGGLALATNVGPSNPLRNGMEHLLDWHLIYREASQMARLAPAKSDPESACIRSDDTGVNVFLEVRKPSHD